MTGTLWIIGTPIGNRGDLSPRAEEILRGADFWLVEDSRTSGKLAAILGIKKPMKRLDEHTGDPILQSYADEIESGKTAALVTDAGTPGISDPGARLVDLCLEQEIPVDSAPGASAVTTALSLSGFFAQRFAFLGFLGRKRGEIIKELSAFQDSTLTLVLFESPFRIVDLLEASAEALPGRRYAVCRELTKLHQQVYRNTLPNLPTEQEMPRKGEFTVVFEGKRRRTG